MYNPYYREFQKLSSEFTLIVDTREHPTARFKSRMEAFENMGLKIERRALLAGDYSAILELPNGDVIDFSHHIAIERKSDMHELMCCFSEDRRRFERELERAKNVGCNLHIVTEEGSYVDMLNGTFASYISPKAAIGTYHAFQTRYGAHFEWVTPETFPHYVFNLLRIYIMEYLMNHYPNGECLRKVSSS